MNNQTKLRALAKAARALNAARVTWAVGASALLYFHGITETFHDLDLIIDSRDADAARLAMLAAGAELCPEKEPSTAYVSERFCEFLLDGVSFDLICGFAIRYENAVYRYPFGAERIAGSAEVLGRRVPLTPLADWYVLYLLMPGRAARAEKVAAYLSGHPEAERGDWLQTWLSGALPDGVREQVRQLWDRPGKG
ncbi:MAG: hypothetical protein PHY64_02160 [Eubacteriales bacterium]|nr:hypothetical protein [Eubacteriales bacterium]